MKKTIIALSLVILLMTGCATDQVDLDLTEQLNALKDKVTTLVEENDSFKEKVDNLVIEKDKLLEDNSKLIEKIKTLTKGETDAGAETEVLLCRSTLLDVAVDAIQLISADDYATLAERYVDSGLGLTFSPNPHIEATDLNFTAAQLAALSTDPAIYTWGNQPGSGDPISLNFVNYASAYVYNQDYANPETIGYNSLVGKGNMITNIDTTYPSASFVEFHFSGFDPAFEGLDWSSLRLIFKEVGGEWKLINLNHAYWTP